MLYKILCIVSAKFILKIFLKMKKYILLILLGFCINSLSAQYTLIPDPEFEQRLITQGIDTEGTLDGQVLTDDIDHITLLVLDGNPPVTPYIYDLTGIEDFISLEDLRFSNNKVEQVDLSNLSNLKILLCKFNALTSIDLSNNLLLEIINIDNCPPGICDQENTLTEIDLSNNVNLERFFSANNYFFELDFSNNPQLESLVSSRNNNLTSLNAQNGNNITLTVFNALENPNLTCITVDDPVAATNGDTSPYDNWNIQEEVIFSEDCTLSVNDYSQADINIYPNPIKNILYIESNEHIKIKKVTVSDILGKVILIEKNNFNQLNLSELKSGIILMKIETENGIITKKLIKE